MNWIFLDFGSYQMKALKAQVESKKVRVLDFAKWDSKPEFFEGLGMPTAEAWSRISIGLSELGWLQDDAGQVVSAGLPSGYLESRYLKFPFSSEKKIERVIGFELESSIPFDIEDMLVRQKVIRGPGVEEISPQAMVLVFAYKRDFVKTFETQLRNFQLSIPALSTESLNLIHLKQFLPPAPVQALLQIGHEKSQLVIFQQNGTPLALKTFYWGAKSMQKALQEELKVDEARAFDLFVENASFEITTDSQSVHIRMADALESSLVEFMNEVRQSLKGLQHLGLEFPKPLPVYAIGSSTRCPGLLTRLEERFRGEFEMQIQPFPLEALSGSIDGLHLIEDPMSALPCLAQALGQTRLHRDKIQSFSESNFRLQQNIQKLRSGTQELLKRVGILLIAPVLFMVLSFFVGGSERQHIQAQIEQELIRNNFNFEAGMSLAEVREALFKEVRDLRTKSRALKEDEMSPIQILADLSRAIPESIKIDIREFKTTDAKILITAETDSVKSTERIVSELRKIDPSLTPSSPTACTTYPGCQSFSVELKRESNS